MKLVRVPQGDGLQAELKRRFADFNRLAGKTRRYPKELKDLVRQAAIEGCKVPELSRLTGLSGSGVRSWLPRAGSPRPAEARRLEVTRAGAEASTLAAVVVVRLPSGVTIELADGRLLTGDLLSMLGAAEGRHAATR